MKDKQDLTTGSVPGKLAAFALPLLLANLLQSFYSIVDMLVVGRAVGKNGLAAVSNARIHYQLGVHRYYHGRHGGGCPV